MPIWHLLQLVASIIGARQETVPRDTKRTDVNNSLDSSWTPRCQLENSVEFTGKKQINTTLTRKKRKKKKQLIKSNKSPCGVSSQLNIHSQRSRLPLVISLSRSDIFLSAIPMSSRWLRPEVRLSIFHNLCFFYFNEC